MGLIPLLCFLVQLGGIAIRQYDRSLPVAAHAWKISLVPNRVLRFGSISQSGTGLNILDLDLSTACFFVSGSAGGVTHVQVDPRVLMSIALARVAVVSNEFRRRHISSASSWVYLWPFCSRNKAAPAQSRAGRA